MARTDKTAALADLEAGFRESNAALLTEYRGLTVAQLKTLRRSIAAEAEYAVVKNTLTKIAAKRAGVEGLDEMLEGPSAIAFVKGDAINVAKALKNFAKEHPLLVIKGGYFDGKVVSADEVKKLADLESREVLLSKVAGVLMATLSKAVRTIDALRASLEDGTETPSEPVATEAPAQAEEAPVVAEEASAPAPAEAEVEAVESAETAETPAEETAETTEA